MRFRRTITKRQLSQQGPDFTPVSSEGFHSHMCARTGFSKLLGALLVWFFAVPLLIAQSLVSGDISGTVTDPSGAVIAAAKIELKSLDRGEKQTTTTNSSGAYRFSLLKPG